MRPLHARPRPGRSTLRPVYEVEVDLVESEPAQALLCFGLRILRPWIELGRDEDLLARQAAGAQGLADGLFVAVGLRRVDVTVAELERPAHRFLGLLAGPNLPDAETA